MTVETKVIPLNHIKEEIIHDVEVQHEKDGSKRKKKVHYVSNAELLSEMILAKSKGQVTDKLARMFKLIAERYSSRYRFSQYSFRDDMVSVALINLCVNGLKFNPEKSSMVFSYITTCVHRSFLQYIADEKKHRDIRDNLLIAQGSSPSNTFSNNAHDEYIKAHEDEGHSNGPIKKSYGYSSDDITHDE